MTTGRRVLTVLPDFPLPATTGLHLRMTGNLDAVARTSQRSDVLWFSTADRTFDTVDVARLLLHCDGAEHAVQRIEQHELGTAALVSSKFRFAITGALGLRSRVYPYSMRYDAVDAASRIAVAVATTGADVVVLPSQGMHWMHHLPSHVDVIIDAADDLIGHIFHNQWLQRRILV